MPRHSIHRSRHLTTSLKKNIYLGPTEFGGRGRGAMTMHPRFMRPCKNWTLDFPCSICPFSSKQKVHYVSLYWKVPISWDQTNIDNWSPRWLYEMLKDTKLSILQNSVQSICKEKAQVRTNIYELLLRKNHITLFLFITRRYKNCKILYRYVFIRD